MSDFSLKKITDSVTDIQKWLVKEKNPHVKVEITQSGVTLWATEEYMPCDAINTDELIPVVHKTYSVAPTIVSALKWTGSNASDMWQFLTGRTTGPMTDKGDNFYIDHREVNGGLVIKNSEGEQIVNIGDYVIRDVEDEVYSCNSYAFEAIFKITD